MSEEVRVKDYYKALLVATSGKGKTHSFRNMNPETTGFINVENKPLPFKNKFKFQCKPTTSVEVLEKIREYAVNPVITAICVDSFSAYLDLLINEARTTKKGFDIWNMYNEGIATFNKYIKSCQKEVYVTAHYEIIGIEGNQEKRVKTKAKEWEGMVEKDYTIVLYADNALDEKGKFNYFFNLAQENTSAKCPPDIFGAEVLKIPNDVKFVDDKIKEFTN